MSNPIKSEELIQDKVFQPTIESGVALIKVLQDLEKELKAIASVSKQGLNLVTVSSYEDIRKIAEEADKANRVQQTGIDIAKEKAKVEQKLKDALSEEAKELASLRLELERVNKANKDAAKEVSTTTGAYDRASQELNKVRKAWKDLAIVQKENTDEGKALKKQLDELDATLKKVDAAAGQHQRNVGNYASGFDGLQNSINQVTREMPAFVNSAQTGFMAISNNLPILVDQITQLREQNAQLVANGQQGVPIWRQLIKSLLSWGTALSVGITLLTMYGKEIGQLFFELFNGKKAFDEVKYSQEALTSIQKEAANAVVDEKTKIAQLIEVVKSETTTKQEKAKAIREINLISPEYLGNITSENVLTKEGKELIDQYIVSLEKKAKAQAYSNKLAELNKELIETELKSGEELASTTAKFKKAIAVGPLVMMETGYGESIKKNRKEEIELIQKKIDAINKMMSLDIENGKLTVETSKADKEAEDEKKKRDAEAERRRKKIIEDTRKAHEEELKLSKELDEKLMKSKIEIIENETARKIASILLILNLEKQANAERYNDAVRVAQLNYNLELKAQREIRELLETENKFRKELAKEQADMTKVFSDEWQNKEKKRIADHYKEKRKEEEKQLKEQQQFFTKQIENLDNYNKARFDRMNKSVEQELNATRKRQNDLKDLAQKGSLDANNSLAYEQRKEAELLAKQEKIAKKKQRQELIMAGLKSYSANAGKPDALPKTMKDIAMLSGFLRALPTFYDGIEDTGNGGKLDNKGGFLSVLHPNERVLTANQNKLIGDMTNDELSKLALNYNLNPTQFDNMPMVAAYNDESVKELKSLNKRIDSLAKIVETRPTSQFQYDQVAKAVIDVVKKGNSTVRTYQKNGGGLLG